MDKARSLIHYRFTQQNDFSVSFRACEQIVLWPANGYNSNPAKAGRALTASFFAPEAATKLKNGFVRTKF